MQNSLLKLKNSYIKVFEDQKIVDKIKRIYPLIKHISSVPTMEFGQKFISIPTIEGVTLLEWFAGNRKNKDIYATQMIHSIVSLNRAGFAHRDLNPQNIIVFLGKLTIIDWDYVTENESPLLSCYDLTGTGLPDPNRTNYVYLFRSFNLAELSERTMARLTNLDFYRKLGNIPSVGNMLGIKVTDFRIKMM